MPYPLLFSPGKIGNLKLKNRLVMPPMVRNYADQNGLVTQRYVDHIESIAKGGVGMMILEASFIRQDGRGFANQLGIHSDKTLNGLKRLVRTAHKHNAAIGIQLYHAGRQTNSHVTGTKPVAPSPIADPTENEVPHQLSISEIETLAKSFGAAAKRAKKAGMDFVEVHGAHGYLITQFLSPFTNKRKDRYGSSAENRFRFLSEVYSAVRKAVGADFPIVVRLSGDELVSGGLRLKDTVAIAKKLESLGADALHITAGNYASYAQGMMIPPMATPDAPLIHLASGVKRAVNIPVIGVAKIRTPQLAEKLLKNKSADFIAIGRTLLADPQWPNKAKSGDTDSINSCIACNQGCISRLFANQDVWCTVNPECGREKRFGAKRKGKSKKVFIAGGGPAGMQAAITAAKRGHKVTIFESASRLGGQLFAASNAPYREDWRLLLKSLAKRVADLGIQVRLKSELTPKIAKEEKPNAVIVATGSTPAWPDIPIITGVEVMAARDVMEGKSKAKGKVVIAGGGCAGAQTAEHLAKKGHKVTIVEARDAIAADAPVDERLLLLERLAQAKVQILINTKIIQMGDKAVTIISPTGEGKIKADSVVLCFGSHSENLLAVSLKPHVPQIITVGDALKARRVTDAILEGSLAALSL